MISKEEAEEKLLKIYYDVKLDRYLKKRPSHANIDMFEETNIPDPEEHFYKVKDDELVIAMWANNYEHGIPYFAVNMAHDSALHWNEDIFSKYLKLYILFHTILPFITFILAMLVKSYSLLGAIIIDIIGTGILIYFIILKINWKKRVLLRFRELFKNTGIFLAEERIKYYAKKLFLDAFVIINAIHGFTVFILFISWGIIFS
ncbi:hypothetical protein DSAG12_00371 [Promethearchaeum syntrophicum]|uniref:Uncharacterized protein n=1 Tax=Promethearchaeum syntrophicum TaxID=2594042 RepID=A0A5B9D5Z8_9ARCH|nr:hypothetical protein [Candidatus Prometheoarchaeum syntrophicum]QEE14558.1 hypothetical protein DSAG12_00371 [Candidatus Prometheoarchaeum syntrophicum]